MVYSMGMNFIKSIKHSPKECAEKYKIMNPPTDIEGLTALKDMWIDPTKTVGWCPRNNNEITIQGDTYGFSFTIHKRFLIEITGMNISHYYKK